MLFHCTFLFLENQVLLSLPADSHTELSGNSGIRKISAAEVGEAG